ncbi:MAG: pantetheine-phosphate adenylyltransferase [Rhodothermales bacterium]
MRIALFPGSFDPFTLGHLDILERGLRIFDRIEVTVATNSSKKPLFEPDERCALIEASIAHLKDVSVHSFQGLIADHAKERNAVALLRGLRQVSDFEYERPMASANRRLNPGLETVFLLPAQKYGLISSTIVRDIHRWGGDVSTFVPPPILEALRLKK